MNNQFQTLRALKGAPLSCLIALAIRHSPTGVMQLCADTGYYKQAIAAALLVLQNLALATKTARFDAWQLTNIGYQLPLLSQIEGGNPTLALSSSSSSLLIEELSCNRLHGKTTTTSIEGGNSTLDTPDSLLIDFMVNEAGATHNMAKIAVRASAGRGDYPTYVKYQTLLWLAYIQSGKGTHINNPGAFIARKIERGEECTEWFRKDPREMTGREQNFWQRVDHARYEWEAEASKESES